MRLFKFFPLFAGLVLSIYGNAADAATTSVISCHNCSWAQYRQQAIASVPGNGQRTIVYVVDRTKRRLAKYSITIENSEGTTYQRVRSINPSQNDITTFDQDLAELDEFQTAMLAETELPVHFPVFSAAKIHNNNQALLQVQDWVNNRNLVNSYLVLSHLFGAKLLENFTADVKVVFPDGSSAIFHVWRLELDFPYVEVSLRYTSGTAVGPEGNLLPDTAGDLPGFQAQFRFESSVDAFLTRMRLLGIEVTGVGGGGITTCEFLSDRMVCTVMPF